MSRWPRLQVRVPRSQGQLLRRHSAPRRDQTSLLPSYCGAVVWRAARSGSRRVWSRSGTAAEPEWTLDEPIPTGRQPVIHRSGRWSRWSPLVRDIKLSDRPTDRPTDRLGLAVTGWIPCIVPITARVRSAPHDGGMS